MGTFIKFISDDPIMLGLCIAIIVLVIMFIVVLVVGRKKDSKRSKAMENTSELLKTEVNLEALESTHQYGLDELKGKEESVVKVAEENKEPVAIEVPVETKTEPTPVEFSEPSIEPAPSVSSNTEKFEFGDFEEQLATEEVKDESPAPIEIKTEPVVPIIESNVEPINTEVPIVDIEPSKEEPVVFPHIDSTNGIIESQVNPIEESDFNGADSLIDFTTPEEKVVETPIVSNDNVAPAESTFEPFDFGFNTENSNSNIFDTSLPVNDVTASSVSEIEIPTPNEISVEPPIVENTVEPIEVASTPDLEVPVVEQKEQPEEFETIMPNISEPVKESVSFDEIADDTESDGDANVIEPYSSIYMDTQNIELPNISGNDFSKTAIMRHIPIMEDMPNRMEEFNKTENPYDSLPKSINQDDDIDLPRLNPNDTTFTSLQGESFNIE